MIENSMKALANRLSFVSEALCLADKMVKEDDRMPINLRQVSELLEQNDKVSAAWVFGSVAA